MMAGESVAPLDGVPTNVLAGTTGGFLALQRTLTIAQCLSAFYSIYVLATAFSTALAGGVLLIIYAVVAPMYWGTNTRTREKDALFSLLTIAVITAGVIAAAGFFASLRVITLASSSTGFATSDIDSAVFTAGDISYDGMSGAWLWGACVPAFGVAILCLAFGWWLT